MNITVGAPHIRGLIKNIRSSDYNLYTALSDLIDNPLYKCRNIFINFILKNENSKIYKIIIADNCELGFENLDKNNENNPFNFTHTKIGHSNDNETSEFGTGMKQAFISIANKATVITKNNNICYKIELDFISMKSKINPNDSFQPTIYRKISEDEYLESKLNILDDEKHKYTNGSIIILESLEDGCCNFNIPDFNAFREQINNTFKEIYGKIKDLNLTICFNNDYKEILKNDLNFNEDKFINDNKVESTLYILKQKNNNNIKDILLLTNRKEKDKLYYKFDNTKTKSKKWSKQKKTEFYEKLNREENNDIEVLEITINSYNLLSLENKEARKIEFKNKSLEFPKNNLNIFRKLRFYGSVNFKHLANLKNETGDNYQNHILNELYYDSKKINNLIGIQYNKKINQYKQNDLTTALGAFQGLMNSKNYLKLDKIKEKFIKTNNSQDVENENNIVENLQEINTEEVEENNIVENLQEINNEEVEENNIVENLQEINTEEENNIVENLQEINTEENEEQININEIEDETNKFKVKKEDICSVLERNEYILNELTDYEYKELFINAIRENYNNYTDINEEDMKLMIKLFKKEQLYNEYIKNCNKVDNNGYLEGSSLIIKKICNLKNN